MEKYSLKEEKYKQAQNSCRQKEFEMNDIIEQFIKDLSGLNSIVPEKYRDKVYQKAYDDGHSAGYYEVYLHLQDLVVIFED